MIQRAQNEYDIIKSQPSNVLFRHLELALKGVGVLPHFTDGQTEAKHYATTMFPRK